MSDNIEKRLEKLAGKTIQEFLDDREDYLAAIAVLERNEPTISLDDLRKKLGLER